MSKKYTHAVTGKVIFTANGQPSFVDQRRDALNAKYKGIKQVNTIRCVKADDGIWIEEESPLGGQGYVATGRRLDVLVKFYAPQSAVNCERYDTKNPFPGLSR